MKAAAILLAAGRGERMGSTEPKAFLLLRGRSLLEWAVRTVESCPDVEGFVVAAPAGEEARAGEHARSPKLLAVITGGRTRQDSVRLALEALPAEFDAVLCHDVARPLADPKLFTTVLAPLRDGQGGGGVVPVLPLVDSVKRVLRGDRMESVPREGLQLAQTPQAFRRQELTAAHLRAVDEGYAATDDAELLEWTGRPVEAVPGDPRNIKVTRPEDLRVAEALLDGD